MKRVILIIIHILIFINIVLSIDPIIKQVKKPIVDSYAVSSCQLYFSILIEYPGSIKAKTYDGIIWNPSIVNGSLTLINIRHSLPIGLNQPVSIQLLDDTLNPPLVWNFNNYSNIDCLPVPTNLTMVSRQSEWVSTKGVYSSFIWIKCFEILNLEKSISLGALTCTVPQPFECYVGEFLNGAKSKNYFAQILALKSNLPYQPFNVVITDPYGNVLHSSPFDGLPNPSNPPAVITNMQSYPISGSTVNSGEMINSAMYIFNIINKNTLCNINSNSDYYLQNPLLPLYGTPANASYIGFTSLQYIQSPLISNVQIIDSQGPKRIGGDNTVYINTISYDNIVINHSSKSVYSSNIDSILINAKADVSFNPNINIGNYNSMSYESQTYNYPYSYSNGTVKFHSISASYIASNFFQRGYLEAYINTPNGTITFFDNIVQVNITDTTNPEIKKVEIIEISFDMVIVRVHATDDISGISTITIANEKARSSDIVYGDQLNGVYEYILNFASYFRNKRPYLSIVDNAENSFTNDYYNTVVNTNLNIVPDYPIYKHINDNNLDPFAFTSFEFKYNDVDVSNVPFNNTLCFNLSNANKTIIPKFYLYTNLLNSGNVDLQDLKTGSWDNVKGMFCIDFQIPARIFTGEVSYILILTPFAYETYYLVSLIGKQAQLRVTSSYGDQMAPVITQFSAFPSNNVTINSNTNVGWDIRIEDSPNGMLSAEFNITSDYDLHPYTIKITPANATSGNINSGTYQLRIPINSNTCRSQSFRITSAAIKDTQGHTSLLPSNLNINPFFKFLNSDQLILNITCPQAIIDGSSPVLTSFTSSANSIDLGAYKDFRNITFTFKTTDSGSGISLRHNPIVYLSAPNYQQISQISTLVSLANNIATYTCTIQLPYGYGAYNNILISIYGIVDNQLNINGYSSVDLQSMGFQSTIKVLYSDVPVLDSTSSINSNESSLTIYGHKFGINQNNITFQIDYQNGQGFINTPISFFSGIVLMTNSITPTSTPFYVRVIVNGKTSNALLVTPTIVASPCKYEVTQSVVSTWINSQTDHYLQASITIKNTGTRPIKLFSFIMDNIDQIWGVTVNGNRYTLPSYNEIINPGDQYIFGYIIKGTTVGDLQQITYQCL